MAKNSFSPPPSPGMSDYSFASGGDAPGSYLEGPQRDQFDQAAALFGRSGVGQYMPKGWNYQVSDSRGRVSSIQGQGQGKKKGKSWWKKVLPIAAGVVAGVATMNPYAGVAAYSGTRGLVGD